MRYALLLLCLALAGCGNNRSYEDSYECRVVVVDEHEYIHCSFMGRFDSITHKSNCMACRPEPGQIGLKK